MGDLLPLERLAKEEGFQFEYHTGENRHHSPVWDFRRKRHFIDPGDLAHELAHYLLAPNSRKDAPYFGLGFGHPERQYLRVSSEKASAEEQEVVLLQLMLELHAGTKMESVAAISSFGGTTSALAYERLHRRVVLRQLPPLNKSGHELLALAASAYFQGRANARLDPGDLPIANPKWMTGLKVLCHRVGFKYVRGAADLPEWSERDSCHRIREVDLAHELAHFILAPPAWKSRPHYGLGDFDNRTTKTRGSYRTQDKEEAEARLLGGALLFGLGAPYDVVYNEMIEEVMFAYGDQWAWESFDRLSTRWESVEKCIGFRKLEFWHVERALAIAYDRLSEEYL